MFTLIRIRAIQIKREFFQLGLGVLLVPVLLCFLIFISYKNFQKPFTALYVTAILLLCCSIFHFIRKDKQFIFNHLKNPRSAIVLEYFVFTLPFSITSLFSKQWFCFPILLLSLLLLSFYNRNPVTKTYFKSISRIISAKEFEWISGFRKSFLFIIPVFLLALAFSWFKFLPLFLLWIIATLVAGFYSENEPLEILREGQVKAEEFLYNKMLRHSRMWFILTAPLLLINTLFNMQFAAIILFSFVAQLVLICCAICYKYAVYQPSKNALGNGAILSILSLCALIPYLLPITGIFLLVYFQKAKQNLKEYLG